METTTEITHARLSELYPNPYQPQTRLEVKEEIARRFGESILEKGLLQIPICRAVDRGESVIRLEMVDGWLRRSGFAWLVANGHPEYERMPIQVRSFTDQQMADMVYVANRERNDLTPIDLAWYYKKYLAEFRSITQAELARTLNISQGEIANTLRLLDLPGQVQEMIISREITESHGRALLQLKNMNDMLLYAKDAVANKWTVATLDAVVKTYLDTQKPQLIEQPPPEITGPPAEVETEAITEEQTQEAAGAGEGEQGGEEEAEKVAETAENMPENMPTQPQKGADSTKEPQEAPISTKKVTPPKGPARAATPAPAPAVETPKSKWLRKLVIEEKGNFVMVGYGKVGEIPKFNKIENSTIESLIGDRSVDDVNLDNPLHVFINLVNAGWEKEGK